MFADFLHTRRIFLQKATDLQKFPEQMNRNQRKFSIFGGHKTKSSLNSDPLKKKWSIPTLVLHSMGRIDVHL